MVLPRRKPLIQKLFEAQLIFTCLWPHCIQELRFTCLWPYCIQELADIFHDILSVHHTSQMLKSSTLGGTIIEQYNLIRGAFGPSVKASQEAFYAHFQSKQPHLNGNKLWRSFLSSQFVGPRCFYLVGSFQLSNFLLLFWPLGGILDFYMLNNFDELKLGLLHTLQHLV